MRPDLESESKRVVPSREPAPPTERRDPSMTGGERAETPQEREERREEKTKPKEPPIIQKEVT